MHGAQGSPIGMLYAYADMLGQLLDDPRIDHWALVLDHSSPSFRKTLFAPYKAHRPPMPDDLRQQLLRLPALAEAYGIPLWQVAGYEADDALASLALCCHAQGAEVWIATPDKDLDQVLCEGISTWDPLADRLRGPNELMSERGITPAQVCDWLCMVGDSADNIPGIRGIGSKGASTLLATYGSLDEVIAQRAQHSARRQQALDAHLAQADMIRTLVRVVDTLFTDTNGTPTLGINDLRKPGQRPVTAIRETLQSFGIPAARLAGSLNAPMPTPHQAQVPLSAVQQWFQQLPPGAIALAWQRCGHTLHLALSSHNHGTLLTTAATDDDPALAQLWATCQACGHHCVVADSACLGRDLPHFPPALLGGCCALAQWLIDPYGDYVCDSGITTAIASSNPQQLVARAQQAGLHHHTLSQTLINGAQDRHYRERELPTQRVLLGMAARGLAIDLNRLRLGLDQLQALHHQLRREIFRTHGRPLDLRRRDEVASLLFTRCAITPLLHDHDGPRVDDQALLALRDRHEVVESVLHERMLFRLIRRVDPDIAQPGRRHGRVHPISVRSSGPSGLLASQAPSLLDLPQAGDIGREIRSVFVPRQDDDEERAFTSIHIPHLELAVLAQLSGDPYLNNALDGADPWRALAAQALSRAPALIAPSHKRLVQNLHRSWLTGRRSFTLSQQHHLSCEQAEELLSHYAQTLSTAEEWLQAWAQQTVAEGYLTTLGGRRVPLHAATNPAALAIETNAADIVRRCLTACMGSNARPVLVLHHEVLFEVPHDDPGSCADIFTDALAQLLPFAALRIGHGATWLEASSTLSTMRATQPDTSSPQQRISA